MELLTLIAATQTERGVIVQSNDYTLDMTNTWANTTNATFDLTGVQVEVGEKATPFEHRSYGDELEKCKRYYRRWEADASNAYRVAFVGHFPALLSAVLS